jgi:hypothetical protein
MTASDDKAEERLQKHWDRFQQLRAHSGALFEGRALDTQRLAAEFGKIGIQTAFLLNGGALAAIPANMPRLDAVALPWAIYDAELFAWGLLSTAVAVLLAYLNYTFLTQAYWLIANVQEHTLAKQFYPEISDNPEDLKTARVQPILSFSANVLAYLAAIFGAASFILFALGVFGFIDLAQHHAKVTN